MRTVDQSEGNYHVTPMTTRGKKKQIDENGENTSGRGGVGGESK